jgi:hypothetical protein
MSQNKISIQSLPVQTGAWVVGTGSLRPPARPPAMATTIPAKKIRAQIPTVGWCRSV